MKIADFESALAFKWAKILNNFNAKVTSGKINHSHSNSNMKLSLSIIFLLPNLFDIPNESIRRCFDDYV